MGRWMSPNWAEKPEAVPYSVVGDPQSLNLYSYVRNNSVSKADKDGHCGTEPGKGNPCAGVKVTAEVTQKPTMQENVKVGGSLMTGVSGKITFTITKDGKPQGNVPATEKNTIVQTNAGEKGTPQTVERAGGTQPNGNMGDTVSMMADTNGSKSTNQAITKSMETNVYTMTDKQTMNFTLSDGTSCSCTETRVLTNADPNGNASSQYTLRTTQPVVRPDPQ